MYQTLYLCGKVHSCTQVSNLRKHNIKVPFENTVFYTSSFKFHRVHNYKMLQEINWLQKFNMSLSLDLGGIHIKVRSIFYAIIIWYKFIKYTSGGYVCEHYQIGN